MKIVKQSRKQKWKTWISGAADSLNSGLRMYRSEYGIAGILAAGLVLAKTVVFYSLMGTGAHFLSVCLLTLLFTFLLFRAFRNKWIPAGIFMLLSVLMFCDVTYSSFFNRYLSVGMIGAAEVVGDIGASIREVLRPINFFMLADAVFILGMLALKKKERKKNCKLGASEEAADSSEGPAAVSGRRKARRLRREASRKGLHSLLAFAVLAAFFAGNGFGSSYLRSISNQEFYTYHIKDIAGGIFGSGVNENMAAYTDSYQKEKNGPLFGKASGKNLIMIQTESLQDFVIGLRYNGQEVTPNLNALIEGNTTYFDNFYQQVGSGNTSDAEFAANNSLYGTLVSYTYKLFNQNYFRGLPVLLSEQGYDTAVFHAHEDRSFWSRESMYPAEGFQRYYGGLKGRGGDYEMTEWMGWGLTDSEFFPQTVEYMKDLSQPFYGFVITISNHHPYEMLDKYRFIDLLPEDRDTVVGNYIQSAAYTDYALGVFFDELKKAGLYENSIFVLYGDHTGLAHSEDVDAGMERVLGKPYDYDEMLHVPLLIHTPDESVELHDTIHTAGGETDILPTISYLLGLEELDTIYVGHNLYTVKEGFVAEQTYMTKGSFFTNDIAYEMARDGVFENGRAWNIHTGESVDLEQCYEGYLRSVDVVNTSEYVLKSDAIRRIFLEGGSAKDVAGVRISRLYPDRIAYAGYPDSNLIGENSEEALNYSIYAGERNLRLDIFWDENSEPYTVNQKTGQKEMSASDIIRFMEDHAAVNLYFNVEKSGDYLVKYCRTCSPAIEERVILDLPSSEEYSGRYEALLDLSTAGLSAENAAEFIKANKVWAVMASPEELAGEFSVLLKGDTAVYSNDENTRLITKMD